MGPLAVFLFALLVPVVPDTATMERLVALKAPPDARNNLEAREREYQTLLEASTRAHLAALYSTVWRPRVKTYYAAFIPADGLPGKDLGFGLHVTRRLVFGDSRIVEVNEQWEEDPRTGELFPLDAVRVKMRFGADGPIFFDLVRVTWSKEGIATVKRATRFRFEPATRTNRRSQMRIAVSAPMSCVGCHHPRTPFAADFRRPWEVPVPDAIVHPARFDDPLSSGPGYRKYLAHREARGDALEKVAATTKALDGGQWNVWTDRLGEALRSASAAFPWLDEDRELVPRPRQLPRGAYESANRVFLDAAFD